MSTVAKAKLRLWDLRTNTCRWPLGDLWQPAEFFCGDATFPGSAYCCEHRQRSLPAGRSALQQGRR